MVQIVIQRADELGEWTMLELQGELISRHKNGFAGKNIGDLHFNKKGVPFLIIGHHILYGKVVKMAKPFAVVVKNRKKRGSDSDTSLDLSKDDSDAHYLVKAIIKTKLVFTTRPKPIIILAKKS